MSLLNGNGRVRFNPEISLSGVIQVIGLIITAVGFYFGLSGRLDEFQKELEFQSNRIVRIETQVEKLDWIVRPAPQR